MEFLRSRVAPLIALAVVVVACASSPSPEPSTSPAAVASPPAPSAPAPTARVSPAPTPTSTPSSSGWPFTVVGDRAFEPVFGPDGTIYLVTGGRDGQLVALDRAGRPKPGWPIDERPNADFGSPAVGADGSVQVEECAGPTVGCVLHRFDGDGREVAGSPIQIPSAFACAAAGACLPAGLALALDGTAYVSHWREAGGLQVLAVDATGTPMPGWPIAPEARGVHWSNLQLGSDGTLFLMSLPDGGDAPARVAAYGPDGRLRPGWPVAVPGAGAYVAGPRGVVVAWSLIDDVGELCPNPRRTVFTSLDAEGQVLRGWPRGSTGHASRPVVGPDGTVYYVSATDRVYAHDLAGEVKAGWPVAVPGAGNGCGPESPQLSPDGTVLVVGDQVTALSPDGGARAGWPYRPAGSTIGPCFDSECFGGHGDLAFGPDSTVHLVVYVDGPGGIRADVVALGRDGRIKPGWPVRLPIDATTVSIGAPFVSPDGRLFVAGGFPVSVLLALDPDGTLSH